MEHQVVIVGGGPTGMMLAAELALAKVDVVIVEKRPDQRLPNQRAGGIHARTIELLDQRGVADRFLARGKTMQVNGFAMIHLDIADLPTRHPYVLALAQDQIEDLLAAWVRELGVPTIREREAVAFVQDAAGVTVTLDDGRAIRAQYLVGCDGGRSVVRRHAGIELVGWDAATSYLLAEVEMRDPPATGFRATPKGMRAMGPLEGGALVRIVLEEEHVGAGEPSVDELRAALVAEYATDFGLTAVPWLSRFTDAARQATTYRAGRVLIAGDAAHVHSPVGGQGLNLGVHDAVNLGWKLARVVHGADAALLDTYGAERHPVGARVLQLTLAQTALRRGDARSKAAHACVAELLKLDAGRTLYGALMSGLDIAYDLGPATHPLVGRRMPDLDLGDGRRVYQALHAAQPVLIDFAGGTASDHVATIAARDTGPWVLPVVGAVAAPSAVLVRPDGHVAWVGEGGSDRGLAAAIATWFA